MKTLNAIAFVLVGASMLGCADQVRLAPVPHPPLPFPQPAECAALGKANWTAPRTPIEALRQRQQGWVQAQFDVELGKVVRPKVIASSPSGLFDQSVIDSLVARTYPSRLSATGCLQEVEFKHE